MNLKTKVKLLNKLSASDLFLYLADRSSFVISKDLHCEIVKLDNFKECLTLLVSNYPLHCIMYYSKEFTIDHELILRKKGYLNGDVLISKL